MLAPNSQSYQHNCRIYRPIETNDASLRFLQFITVLGRQATATRQSMKVYDRNFEILLLNPQQLNAPAPQNPGWSALPTTPLFQKILARAPETCHAELPLQPKQVEWLRDKSDGLAASSKGILALRFKEPNPTIDESSAFAGAVSDLSGCDVRVKESVGMLIFANHVPETVGAKVMAMMNEQSRLFANPLTFAPISFVTPKQRAT